MGKRAKSEPDPPIDLDLRTRPSPEDLTSETKRFDIFLIDTGWNAPVSKAVRHCLRQHFGFQRVDSLYELTPEQSFQILKHIPELIGCDPAIVVYDLYGAGKGKSGNYRGFRLCLGLMRHAEEALGRLQEFIRFVRINRTAENLDREVRRELHREGVEGMVRLLRETSVDLLIE